MKRNFFWQDKICWQAAGEEGQGTEPAPQNNSEVGPDLSFIPQDFHSDGKPDLGKFSTHYQELVAAQNAAKANVPEDGTYDFAIPADLKFDGLDLPENFQLGMDLESEVNKPLFAELATVLKDLNAPKETGGRIASLLARYEASRHAQAITAQKAEYAKLGTPERVTSRLATVEASLKAAMPEANATALFGDLMTADALRAVELLIAPGGMKTPSAIPPARDPAAELEAYYAKKSS